MKLRHLLMAGAALLIGAPIAIAATPAEEKEITKQLNQQQLSSPGTTAATTESGASASASSTPTDTMAESGVSAEGTEGMSPSGEATGDTNDNMDTQATEETASAEDKASEDMAKSEPAAPAEEPKADDQAAAPEAADKSIALTDVEMPKDTLATATVETSTGESVGEVQSVTVGADGKASGVVVEADSFLGKDVDPVTIEAANLTYDPDRKVLITELNKDQIQNLAQAKTE